VIARSALPFSPGAAGPLLAGNTRWWDRAACAGTDTELFFAHPVEAPLMVAEAKAICALCPVREPCLAEALETGDVYSIRGGLTWPERRGTGDPASSWCRSGKHRLTPDNVVSGRKCRACKREGAARRRELERVRRTGSTSPQSGRRAA
jgi:WhiB family transcriptional regulator, redox-sensing transcriptional regulator